MRQYKILFTMTVLMGSFSEIVESETSDDKVFRKLLNKKIKESGISANGKAPRVRDILLVETLPPADPKHEGGITAA